MPIFIVFSRFGCFQRNIKERDQRGFLTRSSILILCCFCCFCFLVGLGFGTFGLRWGGWKGHLTSPNPFFCIFSCFVFFEKKTIRPVPAVLQGWGLLFSSDASFFFSFFRFFVPFLTPWKQFLFICQYVFCCLFCCFFLNRSLVQTPLALIFLFISFWFTVVVLQKLLRLRVATKHLKTPVFKCVKNSYFWVPYFGSL